MAWLVVVAMVPWIDVALVFTVLRGEGEGECVAAAIYVGDGCKVLCAGCCQSQVLGRS